MVTEQHWLLPEGMDELPPPQAGRMETLRRALLDTYAGHGYELIQPSMLEYIESLLVNGSADLDLRTFKVTDLQSARMLGFRADITPQAARIDAHQLGRESPNRLCYCATVLHTRPDSPGASRAPLQLGVELYGHNGMESELEILELMVRTLEICGIDEFYLDLGHVGLFRALAQDAGLPPSAEYALFDAMQRKANPEIVSLLAALDLDETRRRRFAALPELCGGSEVLEQARALCAEANAPICEALDELQQLADALRLARPELAPHFDLAELRGYHYHTGIVFAAFLPQLGQEVLRGGRYNEFGRDFGRSRPAVGFSGDLRNLYRLGTPLLAPAKPLVYAPWSQDPRLAARIEQLRLSGRRVVQGLPGQAGGARDMGCAEQLVAVGEDWQIQPLD